MGVCVCRVGLLNPFGGSSSFLMLSVKEELGRKDHTGICNKVQVLIQGGPNFVPAC